MFKIEEMAEYQNLVKSGGELLEELKRDALLIKTKLEFYDIYINEPQYNLKYIMTLMEEMREDIFHESIKHEEHSPHEGYSQDTHTILHDGCEIFTAKRFYLVDGSRFVEVQHIRESGFDTL